MKPEEVRRRIEECKEKCLTELNFNNEYYGTTNEEKLTSIPAEVFNFSWIEKLDLSSNQLSEIPASISRLQNLSYLNLSSNQLSELPDSISHLQNLSYLNLSSNQLSEIPDSISHLQNLSRLDLSHNQLIKVSDSISRLQNLSLLNLSSNQLSELPDSFFPIQNLSELFLNGNQLSKLPDSICRLQNLSLLNLSSNQLSELPNFIPCLQNLSKLFLSGNQLREISDSIFQFQSFQNLSLLNLSSNQLSELPDSICRLQNLSCLNLSYNQLSKIPDSICRLQNLSELYLNYNQLREIPDSLSSLQNLSEFYLDSNQLSEISDSICRLQKLSRLDLKNNPLVNPPIEIANRGIWAIREYFREKVEEGVEGVEEGEDNLSEAKLIIVGEGGAGKTTLARKIRDPDAPMPTPEETTKGIDVLEWHFEDETGKDFRVNIWDFGGQEIYHNTHRYFLTKRSLYLLVADSRKEHPHLDYWLNIIELLSENSPLLIIKNELEDRCVAINEAPLRERFANLKNENLATNLGDIQGGTGLKNIQKAIIYYISQLPHIGTPLPKKWINVREDLEQNKRNYISLDEYLQICDKNGYSKSGFDDEKDDNRLYLSEHLHDLGVILHFQEKQTSSLYKTIILKPKWATDAAYKVLDNKRVRQNRGKFTIADLQNIWQDAEYQKMKAELLELMQEFNLCYPLPHAKNTYIAPQLLDANQPKYIWNDSDNLLLRYEYDFMPKGILSRFIVEMHKYIDEPNVWLSGVLLKRDHTSSEIIETYDRREIKIRLSGSNKRGFLEVITDKLDEIHATFNKLRVKKLIPCNCLACKDKQKPHFYDLDKLRERIRHHKQTVPCDNPPYEEVNILSLIDDIGNREKILDKIDKRNEEDYPNITVLGDFHGDIKLQKTQGGQSIMEENQAKHLIKTETYNEQTGNFGIGQMSGGEIQDNAKVGGIINESQQKSLAEVAKEIQELLDQLSQTYPTIKTTEKMEVVGKAIDIIEENPSFKSKVIKVLKAVGTESFKEAVDHPLVNILMAGIEAWTE
jgi:internalin A